MNDYYNYYYQSLLIILLMSGLIFSPLCLTALDVSKNGILKLVILRLINSPFRFNKKMYAMQLLHVELHPEYV